MDIVINQVLLPLSIMVATTVVQTAGRAVWSALSRRRADRRKKPKN
jgi:hypothetical protein